MGFYSARALPAESFTIPSMTIRSTLKRLGLRSRWSLELGVAAALLLIGAGLMPILIFYAGAGAVGRYEGASLERLFHSLYTGLGQASVASWIVVLGPYGLYLLFRALRAWWRASAHFA
jgi:hypothetical protein